jgi:hypothetical protein
MVTATPRLPEQADSQAGELSDKPIFVVGFPRSGTTLLQSLICTHDIVSFPETHFFSTVTHGVGRERWFDITEDQLSRVLEGVQLLMHFRPPSPDEEGLLRLAREQRLDLRTVFESVIKAYSDMKGLNILAPGARWLEKTPDHVRNMAKVRAFYPKALFVAIVRDPLAAVHSYNQNLVEYRRPYPRLARQWRESVAAIEALQSNEPEKICCVRYEDLTKNTKQEMENIFRFLDLPFHKERLAEHGKVAEKLILPHETWKNKNRQRVESVETDTRLTGMGKNDILKLQHTLRKEIIRYGYRMRYPCSQTMYSLMTLLKSPLDKLLRRFA